MTKQGWIEICVCSRRRPDQLRQFLCSASDAIGRLQERSPYRASVLLVENDDTATYRDLVDERTAAGMEIRHVLETAAGLSHARNRALKESQAEFILFVDDDQILDPEIILEFIRCQAEFRCQIVAGYAPVKYPAGTAPWRQGYFEPASIDYGRILDEAGTNCLFLETRALSLLSEPYFDPKLNFSGGEDIDFTTRLHEQGARIVSNPRAIAWENFPAERTTVSYILKRTYRNWVVGTRLQMSLKHKTARRMLLSAAKRSLAGAVWAVPLLVRGGKGKLSGIVRMVEAIAIVASLLGTDSDFYRSQPGFKASQKL